MGDGHELLFAHQRGGIGRVCIDQINLIGSNGFALFFKAVKKRQVAVNIQLFLQPGIEDMP